MSTTGRLVATYVRAENIGRVVIKLQGMIEILDESTIAQMGFHRHWQMSNSSVGDAAVQDGEAEDPTDRARPETNGSHFWLLQGALLQRGVWPCENSPGFSLQLFRACPDPSMRLYWPSALSPPG